MLYVYDQQFNRLGMVGKFSYLLWRKRYSSHGEAELHVDATTRNIQLLQKGHILYREDDNEAMYVYYRGFSDDNQSDQLTVKCFSLTKWLDRRILWGIYNFDDTPENIIRSMIMEQCINPTNTDRLIPEIQLASPKGFGTPIQLQASYVNLLEKVEEICNTYDIGIRGLFGSQHYQIELYEGLDRTVDQSENQRIILSKDFANVLTRNYEDADNDLKNTTLIGGSGEGAERKLASIENGQGLERREVFVDASDISDEKKVNDDYVPIPTAEYTNLLMEKGNEQLKEFTEYTSFDCELDVTKDNTKYGRDFFLGDVITIRDDKLDITMNSRVIEVDEVFSDTKSIYAKVGKSIPTLSEKVRKMVKK